MRTNAMYFVPTAFLGAALLILGCADKAKNCDVVGTCPPDTTDGGNGGGSGGGTSSACPGGCSGATPLCDTAAKKCVQCLGPNDCTSASASLCVAGTCSPCTQDTDCGQIAGKNACGSGTCVLCTASNESACHGNSCNPATKLCTQTPVNSLGPCEACKADSECQGGDPTDGGTPVARCVPMTFNGNPHNAYCLQRATVLNCTQPYKTTISGESLSGTSSEQYCGINQTIAPCEAVMDLAASKACSGDTDCGMGQGGLCKNFSLTSVPDLRCTIPCDLSSQCPSSLACTNNTTLPNYCH